MTNPPNPSTKNSSNLKNFYPLRCTPKAHAFTDKDVLVLFGELFPKGYVTGILREAKKARMKVIYGTVGRRDLANQHLLCPLSKEEWEQMPQPLINCPLEAGFDLYGENNICKQLAPTRLSQWQDVVIDEAELEEQSDTAEKDFCKRTQQFMEELQTQYLAPFLQKNKGSNLVFVHLMAGGIPRLKVLYALMNRIFKGLGEKHLPSQDFWESSLGRLCEKNFESVTARTFHHLIELSKGIREKVQAQGGKVSYLAYGYHGTEILRGGKYQWQSYSPYIQGWAKLKLEAIAYKHWQKGVQATVFNCPEILTRSSSVFSGLEVSLYPLLFALKEGAQQSLPEAQRQLEEAKSKLQLGRNLDDLLEITEHYHQQPPIQEHCQQFEKWPQHNHRDQMALMIEASKKLFGMQKEIKKGNEEEKDSSNLNSFLSEMVLSACGKIMLNRAWNMERPVEWIGHDGILQSLCNTTQE